MEEVSLETVSVSLNIIKNTCSLRDKIIVYIYIYIWIYIGQNLLKLNHKVEWMVELVKT